MAAVYLETSLVSACVTDRTDPASLYRREASMDWWQSQRHKHADAGTIRVLHGKGDKARTVSMDATAFDAVGGGFLSASVAGQCFQRSKANA